MTAQTPYNIACALMDEFSSSGTVNTNTGYEGSAPTKINLLQHELAFFEDTLLPTGTEISALTDTLTISDDTAYRIMPYGLAAMFALDDRNGDAYNDFKYKYESLKQTIRVGEVDIDDYHGILTGMNER